MDVTSVLRLQLQQYLIVASAASALSAVKRAPLEIRSPLSKAHGLAVVSAVAGAQALARLRIDHDALRVAPLAAPLDFVPHGLQQLHRIRREADALHADCIRYPLVMKPR